MSNQTFRIPKRGNAGVAFLGVEIKDAAILILSVFAGLICGSVFDMGNAGYLGMPVGGYVLNRLYVDWQSRSLPGALRNYLFTKGFAGYAPAITDQKTLFVGDGVVINPASTKVVDGFVNLATRSPVNGNEHPQ